MAEDLRLYFFSCGSLKTTMENIKMNEGLGELYEVPVPFFLITHPRGNVLFDGGNALEVGQDAREHWGAVVDVYEPVMTEGGFGGSRLQGMGVGRAGVGCGVQAQLHLDRAGGVGRLPNAQYVVQR